jgi:ABC-2 type transport system ATP-binding protein
VSAEPSVVLRDLEKRFGDFVAVDRISLSVRKGEIFGFLGPNGAGKSTTIRMLCGIIKPTSGEGRVAGFDLRTEQEKIKASIGYMSQRFSLYDDLTVEENLHFYGGIYGLDAVARTERKRWVLAMAGLEEHRSARTKSLPVGWKQRLALGAAVLHEPQVVFLDEPTSGVDPISRRRFWDVIYQLSDAGTTVFVTTHYMEEAEYCERLGLIYRGELVATGTPEELKTRLMRGTVLEIVSTRPSEALAVVERLDGIDEAALFGTAVHAIVANPGEAIGRIDGAMRAAGIDATSSEIRASLEDVFVALIRERDRSAGVLAEVRA